MDSAASSSKNLSKEQKIGFVLLLVFGLVTVVLGILQLRSTIYSSALADAKNYSNIASVAVTPEDRLKSIDTDHDSLSDYDELFVYGTSPYLPDTDSDGISDKVEVEQGTNPNCPQGQTCGLGIDEVLTTSTAEQITGSPLAESASLGNVMNELGIKSMDINTVLNLPNLVKDPAQLRQLLVNSGKIDPALLSNISDAQLATMVGGMLGTSGQASASTSTTKIPSVTGVVPNAVISSGATDVNTVMNDPKKLREMLLSTGRIKPEQLSKISDAELLKMAKDVWSVPSVGQ